MRWHFIEPRTRKYVKGYGFLLFARIYKILLDTGLDCLKAATKKVVHKASKILGNKIADAVTKSSDDKIAKLKANWRNFDEIIILQKKEMKY